MFPQELMSFLSLMSVDNTTLYFLTISEAHGPEGRVAHIVSSRTEQKPNMQELFSRPAAEFLPAFYPLRARSHPAASGNSAGFFCGPEYQLWHPHTFILTHY